jgi:hypothetical protein
MDYFFSDSVVTEQILNPFSRELLYFMSPVFIDFKAGRRLSISDKLFYAELI